MNSSGPTQPDLISTFGRLAEVYGLLEKRLGQALRQQCGIPHSWFEVLLRISRSDGSRISMGTLAEQITLTTGGITRLIDRMVDAGYVARVPSGTDRRISYASLTPAGQAKLDETTAVHRANLEEIFAGFSATELSRLDSLLDRLRRPART